MKKLLLIAAVGFVSVAYSQKGNTSSAGIAFKNFQTAQATGDMETAVKELKDAKEFIDKSYVHEDTKDDPKTLMYYGKIYFFIPQVGQMAGDEELKAVDAEKALTGAIEALKRSKEVDKKGRYHDDVDEFCGVYRGMMAQMGIKAYEEQKFMEAAAGLLGAATFADIMGDQDSMMYFYGGMAAYEIDSFGMAEEAFAKCVELGYQPKQSTYRYSQTLQKQDKIDEAEKMLDEQLAKYPGDKDIMIEKVNLYIATDRKQEAIDALDKAIELDPKNITLLYTTGTIYENMADIENAERMYKQALEIDPKDGAVLSALGGLYFNKGADLNNEANKLEFGDPKYDPMVNESKEYFAKAVPFLEQAVEAKPEDCTFKIALKDAYGKAGMKDKFLEAKKAAEACK